MTTIALTEQNFDQTIGQSDIVLIDFWAQWCGPCRQFAPIYDEVSQAHPDITFAKVDTEAEQGLAAAAQITSIPTVMVIRQGIPIFAQPGALPKAALEDIIDQARKLDMDDVRAQMARAQQESGQLPDDARSQAPSGSQATTGEGRGVPGVDYPDINGAVV